MFASSDKFEEWFSLGPEGGKEKEAEVVQRLHGVLRPFLLRRVKSDVERALPPKKETILKIGMSEMQRKWCARLAGRWAAALARLPLLAAMPMPASACSPSSLPRPSSHLVSFNPSNLPQTLTKPQTLPQIPNPKLKPQTQVRGAAPEGHRGAQRRRRPLAAAQRRHAAAQVLQPPVPVPGRGAGAAVHDGCVAPLRAPPAPPTASPSFFRFALRCFLALPRGVACPALSPSPTPPPANPRLPSTRLPSPFNPPPPPSNPPPPTNPRPGEHLVENSGKLVLLDKLLTKLKARGSRVLIFSQARAGGGGLRAEL